MEEINLKVMSEEISTLKERMKQIEKSIGKDLEFSIRTELAYQRHESGDFIEMEGKEFLENLEKW